MIDYKTLYDQATAILRESQESKSISQAVQLVLDRGVKQTKEEAEQFIRKDFREQIPVLRDKNAGKFVLGAVRMWMDGQLRDATTISRLNSTLKYVADPTHINEYDRNLNGLSAQDLIDRFAPVRQAAQDKEREELNQQQYEEKSEYKIIPINSFEEATKYGKYNDWCLAQPNGKNMYDSYTSDGVNQLYVILRDGFENVPKQAGNNTPYDDYGLSMMTVIVDGDGEMTQSTTRWNHENGSTDSALTPKQVSEITGRNFYQTFKPNHKWRKALEEVERRLAAGESINNVFNYVWNTNDGAIVRVLSKYNFYNWDEERIVSKQWFDQLSEFENASYLIAQQGFTYNLMRPEGGLVLPKWAENIYDADSSVSCFARYDKKWHHFAFYADVLSDIPLDDVWRFSYGWSKVSVNDKYNYMDEDGNLMSEEGFYYVEEFVHEFGKVQRSDKLYNFVNTSGDLVSEQWFIEAVDFNADGYAEVTLEDGTPATLYSDGTIELEGEQHESVRPYKSLLEAVSDSLFSNGKGLSEWRLFGKRKDKQPDTPSNTERPQPKTPPGGEGYPLPQPQNTGYDGKSEPGDTEQVDGDFFLTYGNFPKSLYDLIKQHRYFFNIQFVKTDGSLRTARFSTCSLNSRLVPPNGSMTGRWDRKSRNILTFVDLSKINTKTGKPGVISCRLDNIVYVKCGNKLYDFTKQNRIAERFPYLVRENKRESVLERVVASVLKESQESKSISQAVQLILDRGVKQTKEEAEQFIRKDFREQIPVLRDKNAGKFILGAVRMWLDSQLRDATTISRLNSTLKFVADPTHINEYDRNLNGLSAQELIDRFAPVRQAAQDKEREELNRQQYEENSAYKIIPVNSFEEATKYGKYNDWCLAQPNGKNMYDSYTADGVNQLYVILRDGFERVPKQTGENTPYDDYGLSMMTVIVDPDGDMTQSTTRWNHQNGSSDSALTPKQVSEITGRNFYQTFKPNTKFKDAVAEALRKLKAGMSPEQAFEKAERLTDGFWKVWVGKKCNILDTQNRLLSQKWFDDCWDFFEGFAQVQLDDKWNLIGKDGKFLSKQWFDECWNFSEGFAGVQLDGKWNFIGKNGQLLSEQWFDFCDRFRDGFAQVLLYGKWKFIGKDGKFLTKQWFDFCDRFRDGFALVQLDGKWNFIDKDGKLLSEQWFDNCGYVHEGFAKVQLDGKWYNIDTHGRLTQAESLLSQVINSIFRD